MTSVASNSATPLPSPTPSRQPRWLASRSNAALILCACIGLGIFWLIGTLAGIPAEPEHQISLLMQPNVVVAVVAAAIGLVVVTLLLHVLQGSDDPLDPLFGAAMGLAALSWRGGTMTDLLQNTSQAVFLVLIVEMALLAAGLYGCWWMLRRIRPAKVDPRLATQVDWNGVLITTAVSAAIMAVIVTIFATTDAKKQVIGAVAIGGFASAAIGYTFLENDCPLCYAAAPAVVGIVGYAWAYFFPGIYHVHRTTVALAYPLPLDYASVGVAAALLGYWTGLRWKGEAE